MLFSSPLAVGTVAPDFSVPDQDGNRVTLSALRDKNVILVFYPADDTSVCTRQLCEFRDNLARRDGQTRLCSGESGAQPGAPEVPREVSVSIPFANR
jgi:peroxiredoxin